MSTARFSLYHAMRFWMMERPFAVVDAVTGQQIAYQLSTLDGPQAARRWAPEAWALGQVDPRHLAELVLHVEHERHERLGVEARFRPQAGLRRQVVEVEIPEVAKQIGEAASFGDLSENSEYTAALEKRDQLASRATRMENELSLARVINHEMAGSDFVNVGTRVTAQVTGSKHPEPGPDPERLVR